MEDPKINPARPPETRDEAIGRIDALIMQIDMRIGQMGSSSDRGFNHEELKMLTQERDRLLVERGRITGEGPSSRAPTIRNIE